MKLRIFLTSLLTLPFLGCVHWPGIDNKKKRTAEFKVGDKVLVIQPGRKERVFDHGVFDFGPGHIHSTQHPTGSWCVRFETGQGYSDYHKSGGILSAKDFRHREWLGGRVKFAHYQESEITHCK